MNTKLESNVIESWKNQDQDNFFQPDKTMVDLVKKKKGSKVRSDLMSILMHQPLVSLMQDLVKKDNDPLRKYIGIGTPLSLEMFESIQGVVRQYIHDSKNIDSDRQLKLAKALNIQLSKFPKANVEYLESFPKRILSKRDQGLYNIPKN